MIRIQNLTRYYGERLAVDDISFNVEKGEIVGLLEEAGEYLRDKLLVRLTFRLGCRISETLGSSVGDVVFPTHVGVDHAFGLRCQIPVASHNIAV